MTRPRTRHLASLAAGAAFTLVLSACAASRPRVDGPESVEARPAILFTNDARDYVRVYLVGERREWLLGRVEPGSVTTLRVPASWSGERSWSMRLAVIAGDGLTSRAALDPRARFTIAQPASAILSHQWTFSQGQLTPMGRRP